MKHSTYGLGLVVPVVSAVSLALTVSWATQTSQSTEDPQPAAVPAAVQAQLTQALLDLERAHERIDELEMELALVQAQRFAEQQTFQDWLQFVSTIKPDLAPLVLPGGLVASGSEPAAEPEPIPKDPALVRGEEMLISLRNLFKTEGLFAYDLLTAGRVHDGAVGPVVFRLLDDRGRLAGSISAQRLRLEAGRAGQTVTMVLESCEERRAGMVSAFAEMRLPFVRVDPAQWIAKLPELFRADDLGKTLVESKWDKEALRARLNGLLKLDAAAGYLQLKALDGVSGEHLIGVDLSEMDAAGRLSRHLFADSLRIAFLDRGVVLEMFGCVSMRGGVKTPFPGGTHRVYLPTADQTEWRAAQLPGIPVGQPKESPAPER